VIDKEDDISVSLWARLRRVYVTAGAILGFGLGPLFGAEPVSCAVGGMLTVTAFTALIRDREMLTMPDARRYILLGFSLLFFLLGVMVLLIGSELLAQRLVTAGAVLSISFACVMIVATRAQAPERADELVPVSHHSATLIAGGGIIIANEIGIASGNPLIWLCSFVFALLFCRLGLVLALRRLVLDQRP
jgi:hypothetical protein